MTFDPQTEKAKLSSADSIGLYLPFRSAVVLKFTGRTVGVGMHSSIAKISKSGRVECLW